MKSYYTLCKDKKHSRIIHLLKTEIINKLMLLILFINIHREIRGEAGEAGEIGEIGEVGEAGEIGF